MDTKQSDYIKKELESLGLTKPQTTIYLFLMQHTDARIQEISHATDIPRSSVYENLKALEKLGLTIEIRDQHSVRIKPNGIGIFKHALHEKLLEIRHAINTVEKLENSITLLTSNVLPSSTSIRYYKGQVGARQLFWNTVHTKDVVYVYSGYKRVQFLGEQFYTDFVQKSKKNHIQERVLINPTKHAIQFIQYDTCSPISRTKIDDLKFLPQEFLLVQGETLIYDNIYAQVNFEEEKITGFEIESESFVRMQRSIYETLWNKGKSAQKLLSKTPKRNATSYIVTSPCHSSKL